MALGDHYHAATPPGGSLGPRPRTGAARLNSLVLWRALFLGSAIFGAMIALQVVWTSAIGGLRGLEDWVLRITGSQSRGFAWAEFGTLLAGVLLLLVVAWNKQSRLLAGPGKPEPSRRTPVKPVDSRSQYGTFNIRN